jgi:hypothetical protein
VDKHLEAEIDRSRIDDRAIPGDHTGFLEPANPAQARRRAQPYPVRELDVGETPLRLQMPKNCSVDGIHGKRF